MSLAAHYEAVRDRHGYDRIADLGPLVGLERRFVAVDGRDVVESALDRPTTVCMGVGMTGPPHLGTVGQILTAIELQDAGFDVQSVVADLEPYHGGADWNRVRSLAERYRAFALDLGFDPERGTLRTQSEATDVMATAERLAPYFIPEEWDSVDGPDTEWSWAVEDAYDVGSAAEGDADASGGDGSTSEAASVHSAVLHGADFLHPLREGAEQVIVALGVDEHGLTPWTRQFLAASPVEGAVAGLHTRMVPGFDEAPKMSKSIDVGLSLDMPRETIRERVATAPDDEAPETSTVFQAMCLASRYDAAKLDRLEAACRAGGAEWTEARQEYAAYVTDLAERWRASG